jgi:hypothetical protein
MGLFKRWWADEPARFWAALTVFVNAVIAFVVAMDWLPLNGEQVALLYLVVVGGMTMIGGEEVRRRVTPTGDDAVTPSDS